MALHPWSGGFRSLVDEWDYRVEDIDGEVPAALRGTLFRNGSGRNALDGKWFAHWFDGDGMVQAIRFGPDGIRYRNRYVATANYRDETRAGRIVHRGFGKMRPGGMLANIFRPPANVSNTSAVLESGRLLSLWEGGPPHELDPRTLETRGIADFGGTVRAFSAHPKIDPESGELFNFGIDYGPKTTLTPYRLKDGKAASLPAVTLPCPLMNHDFVLTRRHLVFCLGPIVVRPLKMILGLASFDGALHWDGGKPTLILLVPRDGDGKPRIIEADPFFQFHFANGYESGGSLVLDLARYPDYSVIGQALRDFWRSDWPAKGMATLTRLRVDLASGKVETQAFGAGTANEFPTINPLYVGRRHRFAYIACNSADSTLGLQQRIARVDVENGTVATHDFGPGGYPGEAVFIPTGRGAEDNGVLVTLVFEARTERSAVVGLDARDVAAPPLFTARLKHHAPFGLHGCFVPQL
jgi:all-trans-8'-apo-beta-carotenal 15,15'-oxygenase